LIEAVREKLQTYGPDCCFLDRIEYEYEYRDAEYEYEKKHEQIIAPKSSIERF
jgi:hypothetical protein